MAPKVEIDSDARHVERQRRRITLTPMETHLVATVGEFVGTFLFLFFAYAGNLVAASRAPTAGSSTDGMRSDTIIFIALAYSFSLLVNVWAFYRISGGLFNPAVSFLVSYQGTFGSTTSTSW